MIRMVLACCLAMVGLVGCTTVNEELDSRRNLYEVHSYYNMVLEQAVLYAESEQADPGAVAALNKVNKQVTPAIKFAHALIACTGYSEGNATIALAINIKCSDFSFTAESITKNAGLLTSATGQLITILKSKGILSWETPSSYYSAYPTLHSLRPQASRRQPTATRHYAQSLTSSQQRTVTQPMRSLRAS